MENPATRPPVLGKRPSSNRMAFVLPGGFLILAVVLFATSGAPDIPIEPTAHVDPVVLVVGPRRAAMQDPPHIMVEGLAENCNACHQIFDSAHPGGAALGFHQEIILRHGLNNRCTNCHDAHDRERLTLRDGATIPFAQTPQLCAQCHGTTFRDWERGTHGKTLGSWITGSASQRRLTCNECHNPHAPAYGPYQPLPGPQTLRMGVGEADGGGHEPGGAGPLQQWLRIQRTPPHDRGSQPEGHP